MTCIVAVADSGSVVIGGDTAASGGTDIYNRADSKVFRSGSYVVGFTTSFRMGQILRHQTIFPEPPEGAGVDELEHFFVTEFVPVVRQSFADHGFAKTATFESAGNMKFEQQGQEVGGLFVIGVAGQIFEIREDYHLGRPAVPYSAIGRGAGVAYGALHAMKDLSDLSPESVSRRPRRRPRPTARSSAGRSTSSRRRRLVELELGSSNQIRADLRSIRDFATRIESGIVGR